MTTYTVGYRNVSDMCNFLIVWGLDWLVPSQLRGVFSQGAAAKLLCSIPSLVTMCRYSCYMSLHHAQARVTKCLQGTPDACSPRPRHLCERVTNICFWCFPCTFFCIWLHLQYKILTIFPYSLICPEALRLSSLVREMQRADSLCSPTPGRRENMGFLQCREFCSVSEKACPAMKELI